MIESKEGHYIHLFPNPVYFFNVSTYFLWITLSSTFLSFVMDNQTMCSSNTDKTVGGYSDLLHLWQMNLN